MKYFDAHAHVQFLPFDNDREEILARMRDQEVGALMVGVDEVSSRAALTLVHGTPDLYASIGLHPNHALEHSFDEPFRQLAADPKTVAIGECGLDYFRPTDMDAAKKAQHELFIQHVETALRYDKPLMIHSRPAKGTQDAYRDLIDILRSYKQEHGEKLRGDIHFFVGGLEEARDLVELGFTLSFTAVLTFTHDYDEVVKSMPLSALLSETDCPYVAPASRRGTRNDPLAVIDVIDAIAGIRGEEHETVRAQVLENTKRLFSLSI